MFSAQPLPKFQTKEVHDFPLECLAWNQTLSCPNNYPTTHDNLDHSSFNTCPEYFRWIHEDLRHWRGTGITRDMVEVAKRSAHFRLIILDGKAYVETFRKSFQTRDLFTLWRFQQLLRLYPGRIPDVELMFNCDDRPVFNMKQYFRRPNPGPPPLFKYCSDPWSLDIVSPDWSFWGWYVTLFLSLYYFFFFNNIEFNKKQ
ncbi:putative glycosyl transferase CAP10 domain-containing protein [Helianthus annuus]|nr:putative glycosyl transferase CAP10 domain-containing protein [Helianthus annuus]